jgi:tetratricopeptide (TPR) repeat protein
MARPEDAITHMRRAVDLDPMSFFMNRRLGATLYLDRHYDEALDQLRRAAEMEPTQHAAVDSYLSLAYEKKGMRDEAVEHDLAAVQDEFKSVDAMQLRLIYRREGWEAYWLARIKVLRSHSDYSCTPYDEGVSYLRLGDRDQAFSSFNRALDKHCFWMALIRVDPLMDSIRSDSRYTGLLQRLNMSGR